MNKFDTEGISSLSSAEIKEIKSLNKQRLDYKQAPKLAKILNEYKNNFVYFFKRDDMHYPAFIANDKNLFACKDSKDLAKCANDKVQAEFKACFKKAGDNTMAKLGCEQYLKQY